MNYDLIHYFSLTRSRSSEPEPKLQYTGPSSGSGQKFPPLAARYVTQRYVQYVAQHTTVHYKMVHYKTVQCYKMVTKRHSWELTDWSVTSGTGLTMMPD